MWKSVARWTGKRSVQVVVASVVSLSAGAAAGYIYAKKELEEEYNERANREIAEETHRLRQRYKDGEYADPIEFLRAKQGEEAVEAIEAHKSYLGLSEDSPDVESDAEDDALAARASARAGIQQNRDGTSVVIGEKSNVFDDHVPTEDEGWDYEVERAARDANPGDPYVIHHDEYYENETNYEQAKLTYFDGDNVLLDERDQPVADDSVVGEDNLAKFGHGSKDHHIVYVRNDNVEVDFEIHRSMGSWQEELGFGDDDDNSLKHGQLRRFRHRDE